MKNLRNASPFSKRQTELEAALRERELRLLTAERARRGMADFVAYTRPDYCRSAFSAAVCGALDAFLREVTAGLRPLLILQAPPQHGKSELVSRRFPAFVFGRLPDARIAACSYSADLSRDMNRDVRRIMMEESYQRLFPEIALGKRREDKGAAARLNADRFEIAGRKGSYVCAGVGGPLTGRSVDIGIIDDPIKNEAEARSATVKRTIQGWYNTVFLTRLSRRSGHIIMATSWAVDDLAATVAKTNPRAKMLKFPAITYCGRPTESAAAAALSDKDASAAGEASSRTDDDSRDAPAGAEMVALAPELHPLEKLLEIKAGLSPAQWSALYQQSPVAEGGNIFQESGIRRWSAGDLPEFWDEVVLSWDMAFKDTSGGDFAVGQVWGRRGPNFYLLDQVRARMGFTACREAVRGMSARHPQAAAVLIEDKANGPAVIDALKDEIPGLVPVQPDGSKIARAHAVTALWAGGNVHIPADGHAPWVRDFVEELIAFPAGGHDDQVDAMTQALRYLKAHGLSVWEVLADA